MKRIFSFHFHHNRDLKHPIGHKILCRKNELFGCLLKRKCWNFCPRLELQNCSWLRNLVLLQNRNRTRGWKSTQTLITLLFYTFSLLKNITKIFQRNTNTKVTHVLTQIYRIGIRWTKKFIALFLAYPPGENSFFVIIWPKVWFFSSNYYSLRFLS